MKMLDQKAWIKAKIYFATNPIITFLYVVEFSVGQKPNLGRNTLIAKRGQMYGQLV